MATSILVKRTHLPEGVREGVNNLHLCKGVLKGVTTLIGLDCGSKETGVIVLTEDGIREGRNLLNENVFDFVCNEANRCDKLILVIEDVRPYKMWITDGIIQTIKFLGILEWRFKKAGIEYTLRPRWEVKKWIFVQFGPMAEAEISKNMIRHYNLRRKKGEKIEHERITPTFIWVDDRIIQKAMRSHWGIPKPKVGQRAMFGLKDHAWQALGVASLHIASDKLFFLWKQATL